MAVSDFPVHFISRALREGRTASAALTAYREAGGKVRTQTWYQLYGQAQAAGVHRGQEPTRNLHRRPLASEAITWTTRGAKGVMQQVELYVRERSTGLVVTRYYNIRSDKFISRANAIRKAMAGFNAAGAPGSGSEGMTALGGVHVGAIILEPGA